MVIFLCASSLISSAQKVNLKAGQVLIDSKPVMSYTTTISYTTDGWVSKSDFQSIKTGKQVLQVEAVHGQYISHTYVQFPENKVYFDSYKIAYGGGPKPFLQKLINAHVLNADGEIDTKQAELFKKKYKIREPKPF